MTKSIIIGLVALIFVGGGGYLVFHKSSTKPTTTTETTTPAASSTNSTSKTSSDIVQIKTDATIGQYLADANGNALYTYGADTAGVSNCSGACLYSWPAYAATTSTATLPANVTIIKRTDGSSQYAYKSMPLYAFSSDSSGKVTGNNISNFHVAKP